MTGNKIFFQGSGDKVLVHGNSLLQSHSHIFGIGYGSEKLFFQNIDRKDSGNLKKIGIACKRSNGGERCSLKSPKIIFSWGKSEIK
jgi:hypothetical protein